VVSWRRHGKIPSSRRSSESRGIREPPPVAPAPTRASLRPATNDLAPGRRGGRVVMVTRDPPSAVGAPAGREIEMSRGEKGREGQARRRGGPPPELRPCIRLARKLDARAAAVADVLRTPRGGTSHGKKHRRADRGVTSFLRSWLGKGVRRRTNRG
jgi:hypothetical protein